MADPVGIVTSALHAIHKVYDALKKIKGAPEEIKYLQEEAIVLEGIMPQIMDILAKEPDSGHITLLVSRAKELTASVDKFVNAATKSIEGKRKVKKLRWYFKGDEAKELAEKFRNFHGSLSAICGVHSTHIPDHVRLSFSHMDTKLQDYFSAFDRQFQDVRADVNKICATLEELVVALELKPMTCMLTAREMRLRASQQRRGENLAFDQSSVYYDTNDLPEPTNAALGLCTRCRSYSEAESSETSSSTSITSWISHSTATHFMPPLRGGLRQCAGCGCRCHRAQAIQGIPSVLAAIFGKLYLKVPFPRGLWPGLVECDLETCKRDWLMDVKYYFPSWFVQIEMDLRFEALPVHFYIRTPRIVSRLSMYVWHWKFHWNADPKRFRQLLASRLLTVNDIDEQGRSLLHCVLRYYTPNQNNMANLADLVSMCLEAGAQPDWQDVQGLSVIDQARSDLIHGWLDHKVINCYESLILRPLFHESLHEIFARVGFTELHRRACPHLGYPPLTPEIVDNLLPQLNMRDLSGHTPLFYAIRNVPHASRLLLDAGADIRLVEYPLHCAVESSDSSAIKPLINAGADANERDRDGKTPLISVTKNRWCNKPFDKITQLARYADHKLNWNARDKKGYTALDYALEQWNPDLRIIRLLKRHSTRDRPEHDEGSIVQVNTWTWTYGQSGYRCPSSRCWHSPPCKGGAFEGRWDADENQDAFADQEDMNEDKESLAIPGTFM